MITMMSRCAWLIWKRLARVARIVRSVKRLIPVAPAPYGRSRLVMTCDPVNKPSEIAGYFFCVKFRTQKFNKNLIKM